MILSFGSSRNDPYTAAQLRKLWVEATDRGWHKDQIYGRATEINPQVEVDGLAVLTVSQMSTLIDAVINEPPWIDPRQQRLPL